MIQPIAGQIQPTRLLIGNTVFNGRLVMSKLALGVTGGLGVAVPLLVLAACDIDIGLVW